MAKVFIAKFVICVTWGLRHTFLMFIFYRLTIFYRKIYDGRHSTYLQEK